MADLLVSMKCRIADWSEEDNRVAWRAYQCEYAEAADELTSLREGVAGLEGALVDAREKLVWSFHYMIEPESHPAIKRIDAILAKQGGEGA